MGEPVKSNKVVLLFDDYSVDSQNLHKSFQLAGYDYPTVVIEENGFLPEGVMSVFGYFLGSFEGKDNLPGKPRYFNQITVPDYWEISGTNRNGKVEDRGKERGRIFYAEPAHKRLVRVVDWLDERGVVRSSDHYNRYGALYGRTIFNAKGQKVNKTYFSAEGKEILMENFVTGDIILNEGETVSYFHSKLDFILHFFKRAGLEQSRVYFNSLSTPFFVSQRLPQGSERKDVLFWQEPERGDIPGNMRVILDGQSNRTGRILVQKRRSYRKLLELGASPEILQMRGFVYPFVRENGRRSEALICTNSDRIEQCEKLVEALPQVHFHIAALTEMSSKLLAMGKYDNVSLYPGVKLAVLDELFEKCDIYLDVNHESEIVSAVSKAFLNNQMIFAFRETLHNKEYVADNYIYPADQADRMIADIRAALEDTQKTEEHLRIQKEAAAAEDVSAYASEE